MLLILNSLLPVFAIITLGSALKRLGWIDEFFIRASDRLIYYIFFPVLAVLENRNAHDYGRH